MIKINYIIGFFAALLLIGCGVSKDTQKENEIVWPPPPDEPRVKYIKTYTSEDDFASKLGLVFSTLAGKRGNIQLSRPFDVCSDGKGKVFVSDVTQGVIVFDELEKKVKLLGEESPIPLGSPLGIAYGNNKVFVGIIELGQVVVFSSDGKYLTSIGKPNTFPNPVDVAYDELNKRVIIVDNKMHQVFVYSDSGDSLLTIGQRGEEDGEFNFPQSADVDSGGNIYVIDAFNFRIEVFDAQGKYLRKYGEQGNVYGTFSRPKGIALDKHNNIYVVDAIHQNFQIFNNDFELLMFVGKFSNRDNRGFQNPIGIDIDQNNFIYVTDYLNQRVQVFQLLRAD